MDNLNRLLFAAIYQQDFVSLNKCIQKGADVNCKLEWHIECYNKQGLQLMTPLLLATNMYKEATYGDSESAITTYYSIIKLLLENNADPNDFCYMNSRPLDTVSFYIKFYTNDTSYKTRRQYLKLLLLFLEHKAIIYDSVLHNIMDHIYRQNETPKSSVAKTEMIQLVLRHGCYTPEPQQLEKINVPLLHVYWQMFVDWPMQMLLYCINYKNGLILF